MKLPFFKFGKKRDEDDEDDDEDFGDFDPDADGPAPSDDDPDGEPSGDPPDDSDDDMRADAGDDDLRADDADETDAPDDIDEDMLAGGEDDDEEEIDEEHEAAKQSASDDLDAVAAQLFGGAADEDDESGANFPGLDGEDLDDVDLGDDEFDDDDDEGGGPFWFAGKKRLIIIASAAAALVLSLVGGGTWWLFADPAPEEAAGSGGGATIAMALPPKKKGKGGLSPPTGQSLNTIGNTVDDDKPAPDDEDEEAVDEDIEDEETEADDDEKQEFDSDEPVSLNAIGADAGVPDKAQAAAIAEQAAAVTGGVMVASVTQASYARVAAVKAGKPLSKVPDPVLVEDTPNGPLPRTSNDGRSPLQAYARPFDKKDKRPRLAIIIAGLGLSPAAAEAAITRLPGAVTLAFDPYANDLDKWLGMARQAGHETVLSLPLESANLPAQDPGPYALLTTFDPPENLRRLEFLMSRFPGYVEALVRFGSRFTADDKHIRPVLMAIKGRGVMLIDTLPSRSSLTMKVAAELCLPRAQLDIVLDRSSARSRIDTKLAAFEELGRKKSRAIAVGRAYPSTIERVAAWAATLRAKKIVLPPISAFAGKSVKAPKTPPAKPAALAKPADLATEPQKTE